MTRRVDFAENREIIYLLILIPTIVLIVQPEYYTQVKNYTQWQNNFCQATPV